MATRYVTIRVVGADGRPKSGKRVWLTGASYGSGLSKEGNTGSDGAVNFEVDYDGQVAIYVDGTMKIKSERIRGDFKITA